MPLVGEGQGGQDSVGKAVVNLIYEPQTKLIAILQNGDFLNVNYVDENLKDLEIPLSLLMKVYLLRCNNNYDLDCTTPGGMVTDFNMWDRSFTPKELQDWTSCRH